MTCTILVTLACGTSNLAPAIAPTFDPNTIQTVIVNTASAAGTQTAASYSPTPLPTATLALSTETQVFTPTNAEFLPSETVTAITISNSNSSGECDPGDQTPYIYHPDRLIVLADCIHVSGYVEDVRKEADGDLHILLKLDPQYEYLLTPANSKELGDLVIEPVCVDKPTQANAIEPCSKDPNPLTNLPTVGQYIWMEGRYVTDSEHGGWAEIHPLGRWGIVGGEAVNQPPVIISANTSAIIPTNAGGGGAVCSCSGDTLNCSDFSTHSQAQACYNYCFSLGRGDVHGLDGNDKDGLACESLP